MLSPDFADVLVGVVDDMVPCAPAVSWVCVNGTTGAALDDEEDNDNDEDDGNVDDDDLVMVVVIDFTMVDVDCTVNVALEDPEL